MIGPAKIVVRYADGKMLKGYSQDFSPTCLNFHVRRNEAAGSEPGQQVALRDLKAIFFVRDFPGIVPTRSRRCLWPAKPFPGRKLK